MKISIVTAVFNRVNTIGDSIDSLQRQTYPDVEHIVQDGGSEDGTIDEILGRANNNTKLISENDSGIYDAINRGIRRASGDVIGLMHSDDAFANNEVLAKIAASFADQRIDGVYGDLQYVSAHDPKRVVRNWRSGKYNPELLKYGWMPPHPTLYLRREVFDRLGLYDTTFSIAADYDAMLRFLVKGKISLAYIPEVLVIMRMGGESNRSLERILRKSNEDLRAIRKNGIGGLGTLALKNARKLSQFIPKEMAFR